MAEGKVPNRTRKPDNYDYIMIDRDDFVDLSNAVNAILKKQLGYGHRTVIRVDGFDDRFESVKDFVTTLNPVEWKNLTSISEYFYPVDSTKHGYNNSLYLRYGGYSSSGPGLQVEYEKQVNDIQRIAIKENLESLITSYSRRPLQSDKAFSYTIAVLAGIGLAVFYAFLFRNSNLQINLGITLILISGLLYISGLFYIFAGWAHRKIVPHFEPVINKDDSRLKRIGKFIGIVFSMVGFIGTLVAIAQLFMHK